jgi:hypothetical protein
VILQTLRQALVAYLASDAGEQLESAA